MKLSFGKYAGKEIEQILVTEPQYIQWMLGQASPSGPMERAVRHVRTCLRNFDAKPFLETCFRDVCPNRATRFSVYVGHYIPYFWCAKCSPYTSGAAPGKLLTGSTYSEAVLYVVEWLGTRDGVRGVIDLLVQAKGVSKPRRLPALLKLFGSTP